MEGRRARSNLEASADRVGAEPGTPGEQTRILGGDAGELPSLGARDDGAGGGLERQPTGAARDRHSARSPTTSSARSSCWRRRCGARGWTRRALPDLREDHDALLRGGDPAPDRYALVNVETDRIVNSLNTLREDVLRWTERRLKERYRHCESSRCT